MTAYIAGPMRGYKDLNFPAFFEAERIALRTFDHVINPARLDKMCGLDETQFKVSDITPQFLREVVERDIDALLSLRAEDGDAIILLPGWRDSKGAKAELAVAQWLGLRVMVLVGNDVVEWGSYVVERGNYV